MRRLTYTYNTVASLIGIQAHAIAKGIRLSLLGGTL